MARTRRSTGRTLPELFGPWAEAYRLLASPWTVLLAVAWLAAAALRGLDAGPGAHPFDGIVAWVPAALLPFAIAAGALDRGRGRWVAGWLAGLSVILLATVFGDHSAGRIDMSGAAPPEFYEALDTEGRPVRVHLGGQLQGAVSGEKLMLRLGVGEHIQAEGELDLDGHRISTVGPWRMYVAGRGWSEKPTVASLRFTPREGDDPPIEGEIRAGASHALPDGTTVTVQRLTADFGQALGPAAQLNVQWGDEASADWFFVESPDLDARVGQSPWKIELTGITAPPALTLGLLKSGPRWPFLLGWALIALSLFGGCLAPTRRKGTV